MKTLALTLAGAVVATIAIAGLAAQGAPEPTRAMVTSYLELQAGLASDQFEAVKAPARALAAQAAALGQEGADIAKAATAVGTAADLEAARDAFGPLSEAVIARVKAGDSKDADLRLAYCPMAKRSWLQREKELRNPYYGSKMLTCGEFRPLQ